MTDANHLQLQISTRIGNLQLNVQFDADIQTLVLIGPNGSGKSSLLSLVLGVLEPDSGRIALGGEVLSDSSTKTFMPVEARRIGYLPQDYALFPHLTVRENVAFARASANPSEPRAVRTERVNALLAELSLTDYARRRPGALSGGEKQRVALARALAAAPRALLLDEPLAALDVHARRKVRTLLAAHLKKIALPTIIVTHDAAEARELGTHFAVLEAGQMTQLGTWEELAAAPKSRFVARFVASA